MAKPVRLRRLAAEDVHTAVDHLITEAGGDVAARFVGTVETALAHVGRHPRNGSLRFSYELDAPIEAEVVIIAARDEAVQAWGRSVEDTDRPVGSGWVNAG